MRIVVDTNVLLGACLGRGAANAVIAACLKGRCGPLMGNTLFSECEDVFGRDDLFENCRLSRGERDGLLDVFLPTANGRVFIACGDPICRMRQTTIRQSLLWPVGRISSCREIYVICETWSCVFPSCVSRLPELF